MNKRFTFVLVLVLTSSSLIVVKPAQSEITKPAVPEFAVQIVAYPYDVPTTHSIDPYTGQDVTHQGYHVENKSIEVRIKNQPFTPYWVIDPDSGSNMTVSLHYNVWVKGHFAEGWSQVYFLSDGLPIQSSGEYTVFSLPVDYPSGAQVDFKVEAMAGYVHRPIGPSGWPTWTFTGEESWSNVQTITIDANSVVVPAQSPASPNETSALSQSSTQVAASQSGFSWMEVATFAVLGLVIALLIVVIVFLHRRIQVLERKFVGSNVKSEARLM